MSDGHTASESHVPLDQQHVIVRPKNFRARDFDPEDFRMSVGDHLEELRGRVIKALVGVLLAFVFCLAFARNYFLPLIVRPLYEALGDAGVSQQMYTTGVTDPFMVYLRLSLIGAFVISGPWVIYQIWAFIAAGLYPKERKTITKYLPFSMLMFVAGIAFAWFIILPLTLSFFLDWSMDIPLPRFNDAPVVQVAPDAMPTLPMVAGDVAAPSPGQLWFDTTTHRMKLVDSDGAVRVLAILSDKLVSPIITLPDYTSLVLMLLVVFGLSFQTPLLVMAVIRAGIIEPETMRQQRKIVYFAMLIIAAAITPGDVITATIGLIGPMVLLYELGIWMGELGLDAARRREALEDAESE